MRLIYSALIALILIVAPVNAQDAAIQSQSIVEYAPLDVHEAPDAPADEPADEHADEGEVHPLPYFYCCPKTPVRDHLRAKVTRVKARVSCVKSRWAAKRACKRSHKVVWCCCSK